MSAWIILACCIVAEVTATLLLAKSQGFSRPLYGVLSLLIFAGCFWAMAGVITRIPLGVVYAVWSGAGIVLITAVGWLFLQQSLSSAQLLCIALIVAGAVGLKLSTVAAETHRYPVVSGGLPASTTSFM